MQGKPPHYSYQIEIVTITAGGGRGVAEFVTITASGGGV